MLHTSVRRGRDCIHYYYHTSYFSRSSYCVTLVFTTITILHTSVRRGGDRTVVRVIVFTTITMLHTSVRRSSSYCVTLVFTTITILHTSVRRGRDPIVVLIVLHLYSLLLPYFILQSIVVVIVW